MTLFACLLLAMAGTEHQSIPVRGEWEAIRCCVGDLDGDGRFDFVVQHPRKSIDPYSWKPSPDTYKLDAYLADGTFLWRYDMGWAIEQGVLYAPFLAYDLDGDNKAEVCIKAGLEDPRDADGKITSGPEWLVVLDGMTGQEIARKPWPNREGLDYNDASRNKMCVAYLDGKRPSVVVVRGTYGIVKATAYQLQNHAIGIQWQWQSSGDYNSQGSHAIHAADLDGDGRDEVLYGAAAIDHDGTNLWSTGLGHVDFTYLGDIDPQRRGLEIFTGCENPQQKSGVCLLDAKSGGIVWDIGEPTQDIGGPGMCADLIADAFGVECYSQDSSGKSWLLDGRGKQLDSPEWKTGFPTILWDADEQYEIIRGNRIWDYPGWPNGNLHQRFDGQVVGIADIQGDWREELIVTLPGELRIYSTALPTRVQRPRLTERRQYGQEIANQGSGYFLCPMYH